MLRDASPFPDHLRSPGPQVFTEATGRLRGSLDKEGCGTEALLRHPEHDEPTFRLKASDDPLHRQKIPRELLLRHRPRQVEHDDLDVTLLGKDTCHQDKEKHGDETAHHDDSDDPTEGIGILHRLGGSPRVSSSLSGLLLGGSTRFGRSLLDLGGLRH